MVKQPGSTARGPLGAIWIHEEDDMDNNKAHTLTPSQTRAIAALLREPSTEAAAEATGVARSTIYRWLKEPDFRLALRQAEADAVAGASRYLAGLSSEALGVVIEVWRNQANPAMVRLRAATAWLEQMLRVRDAAQLEERIAALERLVEERSDEDE